MKIVLDAMGTDNHPGPDVEGAVLAARAWGDEITLVGDESAINEALSSHDTIDLKLKIVHTSQVIEMTDEPAQAARTKKDSSMLVGMNLVRDGQADAFVSAGNTGGLLAVATLHSVRRIRGIKRPALTAVIPLTGGNTVLLDVGANADCRPEFLLQFGIMGSIYAELVLGISKPKVALLSNGEEPGKGNQLIKESFALFAESDLNFIGNVEGKDLIGRKADVVVTDGFTGNIALKTIEAVARMLNDLIRENITLEQDTLWRFYPFLPNKLPEMFNLQTQIPNPLTVLGGLLAKPAFRRVAKQIDPFEIGGVPLLGLDGVVIGAHGRSNAWAIRNAIRQAKLTVQADMIEAIKTSLETD